MKQKLGRIAGIAVLALVALGAIGLATKGGNDRVAMSGEESASADDGYSDVMVSIDQALGREPAFAPVPAKTGGAGEIGAPPPIAQDADGGSRSSTASNAGALVRPDQPITGPTDPLAYGANAAVDDRKIVQTASLRLQVKEVGVSFEEVGRIATSAGGFIASSNFSFQGEQQVASLTMRVPADRYQDVLSQVRGLGAKVDSEGSNASDVTEEYTDLSARLRNLEATETQLLGFLGEAKNISEVLQVQDRLNNTRSEIERVKGRMSLLDKLTDLATITVHLRPVVAGVSNGGGGVDLGEEIAQAWEDSLQFLGDVAAGVLRVVVFAWWVPFVAVPGWLILGRWLRARPHPVIETAAPVEGV